MGEKHKKYKEHENPIDKLKEWQDNQYNPGYYTGGKIPPYVEIPSKTGLFGKLYAVGAKIVGIIYILAGVGLIFIGITIFIGQEYRSIAGLMGNLLGVIAIFGSLGVLFILYGLKYNSKTKSREKSKS
ncbi:MULTISPECIES: hypothetical protein [Sporomusa]|uniref:Uncharacterized protein n=1 Tax=Sporomusa sphaeroides DSM 2875 TaxID=1337886 RepID=A0ABP2CB35_9FIRM|nr:MULTISPECIES: hypothetical protein [Sporomusa]OLS54513.1 hypothetical protein SPSPH_42980 [Sporomusa sphaeroides DSM 2875]CVK21016.1 hypothetical protein SSPH_03693 [Sporomusa sphaeroides DSM 2875]HML32907.1 hypothetical protein [Sporomusa sphaeroides]